MRFWPRVFWVLRVVIAKSFARIHWQNLVNFGVLPLTFVDPESYASVATLNVLCVERLHEQLKSGSSVQVSNVTKSSRFETRHQLSARQTDVLGAGGLINWVRSHA